MIARYSAASTACLVSLAVALASGAALAQKAPEAAKDAPKVAPVKPKSPCQGIDEAKCKADVQCRWVAETKVTKGPQAGTTRKAHCAKIPPKKAEAKPKAPATAAPAPAATKAASK